jgi:hypothetical protein
MVAGGKNYAFASVTQGKAGNASALSALTKLGDGNLITFCKLKQPLCGVENMMCEIDLAFIFTEFIGKAVFVI